MVEDADAIWANFAGKGRDNRAFFKVIESPFVEQDLRILGLRKHPGKIAAALFVSRSFMFGLANHSRPSRQAEFYASLPGVIDKAGNLWKDILLNDEKYQHLSPLADPKIARQAFYILGYHFVNSKESIQQKLGDYMLKVALYMRNRDATLAVLHDAYHRGYEAPPVAYQVLESLSKKGNDIGAMSLRAEMLMWPKLANTGTTSAHRSEAHTLAQQAFDISEAGSAFSPPPPAVKLPEPVAVVPDTPLTPPWKILQRMARPSNDLPPRDHALWEKATTAGAREYDDPSAYAGMITPPSLVPFGSKDWVECATKAAMHGYGGPSFELGRYYLQQHGWYPTKASSTKRDKTGFEWIELSLLQTNVPDEAAERVLLVALICRESGDAKEGRRWLEMGVKKLDEIIEMKDTNKARCNELLKFFRGWINTWDKPTKEKAEMTWNLTTERS